MTDEFVDIEPAIPERRLVGTLLTGKPRRGALVASLATVLLMGLTTLFFLGGPQNLANLMPAIGDNIFVQGEWWRSITAVFIHSDFGHYASNMYMLGIFSFFVYGYFGWRAYPLVTVLGAAIVNIFSIATYDPHIRLLGASGLVYLLGGFWLILYFFIQRQHSLISRLVRIFGMGLLVFFPTSFEQTTSYRTHAIGFAVGLVLGTLYFIKYKKEIRSKETHRIYYAEEPTPHSAYG